MAGYTWTNDQADGVLKNSALSSELLKASVADTVIQPFCRIVAGFGRRKGESLTVPLIKNIAEPTSAELGESDRIPIDTYAHSSVAITVKEWGRGVEYSHRAELLNIFDLADAIQGTLRDQMKLVLDTAAAAAFKAAKIIFIPTSLSGGTFDTDGTPSTQATQNLTVQHVQTIRDYLADSIHCPPWNGREFVCLASTKALRGIKQDPLFLAWRQYADPQAAFFRGEVGSIENIRFVEVNHVNALSNAKGSGSVLGEALFFGKDAVGMVVAEDPELRADVNVGDFGRQKAVAWYGVMNYGLLWTTANDGEARVIRVSSS